MNEKRILLLLMGHIMLVSADENQWDNELICTYLFLFLFFIFAPLKHKVSVSLDVGCTC